MVSATPARTDKCCPGPTNARFSTFLLAAAFILGGCGTSPDARYQKGRALLKQGNLDDAMREAEAGMRAEPSWRFRILEADVFLTRTNASAAQAVLSHNPPPTDPELLARLKMDLGWAEYLESNYSRAEVLLDEARGIAKSAGLPIETTVEMRLAAVATKQGRMEDAERAFREVIEIAAAQNDPSQEATAMANLGVMYQSAFRFEDAIYWLDKARAIFQEFGIMNYYYSTLGNLGSCYVRLGDSEKALASLQEAEAYAKKTDDRYGEALWIGNSGSVLYDRGDLEQAREKFEEALKITQSRYKNEKDLTGWWYYSLASVEIDLREFDKAESYNQEALRRREAIGNDADFNPRVNEAHIAAGRKDPRAESLYRGLIAEYHPGLNPVPMLEAQTGLAALLEDKGEFDRADAQFRAALAQLESDRTALSSAGNRMTYLSKLIRFYDRYINFLVDRGQPERALEVAESSRARVLDEELESKAARKEVPASRILELARSSHSVFLSYWLGKERSFLWAVTPVQKNDAITIYKLPPEKTITTLVTGYRAFIENLRDPLESEFPAGPKLSQMLLAPVRAELASAHRIVLVPDRSLHALNFETLPDPESPSKYVIDRTTLEVVPSLDMLADRRAAQPVADSLLLIGDPDQAVSEYPRLPFASSEIAQISKAFSPKRQKVLEGPHANPAAYRDAQPGQFAWIHIAAHAAPNQTSPLDSALILSRGENTYQLLARDVMNVPLNASLVTLSACRSAGSKTYSGEGEVGLTWAFLRAGARSVVAGLWDVTDRSTASLMADFYDQLAQNVPPIDALRHAKLTLLHGRKPYNKPFYWGPFQLYAGTI